VKGNRDQAQTKIPLRLRQEGVRELLNLLHDQISGAELFRGLSKKCVQPVKGTGERGLRTSREKVVSFCLGGRKKEKKSGEGSLLDIWAKYEHEQGFP